MRQLSRHGEQLGSFLPVEPEQLQQLLEILVPLQVGVDTSQPVLGLTHNLASLLDLLLHSPCPQQELLQ